MVLPSSTPDPAARAHAQWLSHIRRCLHLGRRSGVLVLVRDACPAQLRPLVVALGDMAAGDPLRVCTRAPELWDAPEGAVVLVRVDAEDASWLNEHRPLFTDMRWRAVLWAGEGETLALRQQAPDFFDCISHIVDCPRAVPGFAVAGAWRAPEHPGMAWRGHDLDATLAAACPDEPITRLDMGKYHGKDGYAALVAEARRAQGLLVVSGVDAAPVLTRLRWALAESGRPGRVVLDRPACDTPGWWPVSDETLDWSEASAALREHLGHRAALVAALLELEPGAVALAGTIAKRGFPEKLDELARVPDPGACLAEAAFEQGVIEGDDVARMDAPPAVLRGLFDADAIGARRRALCARVEDALSRWQASPESQPSSEEELGRLSAQELAMWANARPAWRPATYALPHRRYELSAYAVEAVVRAAAKDESAWSAAAWLAFAAGHGDAAVLWAETHEVDEDVAAQALLQQLRHVAKNRIIDAALERGWHHREDWMRVAADVADAYAELSGEARAGAEEPGTFVQRVLETSRQIGAARQRKREDLRDSDIELLEAWQAGDRRAGDRLLQRHFTSLRRFFLNKAPAADVDDLIQATIMRAVNDIKAGRAQAGFRTLLFRSARNTLADYKQGRGPDPVALSGVSMDDIVNTRQQKLLVQALRHLPIEDQSMLELYYWEAMTANEIGEVMDLSEAAVRQRLRRAKDELRRKLEAELRDSSPR